MGELSATVQIGILTTTSVVLVQRIEPETASSKSVMCINRTSVETGVSRAYNSFVKPGTGIVARLTGARSFRADVSDDVTDGTSWQLGMFLAHALRKEDRLGMGQGHNERGEIWLTTGGVNADHLVTCVKGLLKKMDIVSTWLAMNADRYARIRILIPESNMDASTEERLCALARAFPAVSFLGLGKADDALQQARMGRKGRALPFGSTALFGGAVACVITALALAFVLTRPSPPGAERKNFSEVQITVATSWAEENCYGQAVSSEAHQIESGDALILPANRKWCGFDVAAFDSEGERMEVFLVGRDGVAVSPEHLGSRGSLLPVLGSQTKRIELSFAEAGTEVNLASGRLSHVDLVFGQD